jgi:hypothetical protein
VGPALALPPPPLTTFLKKKKIYKDKTIKSKKKRKRRHLAHQPLLNLLALTHLTFFLNQRNLKKKAQIHRFALVSVDIKIQKPAITST